MRYLEMKDQGEWHGITRHLLLFLLIFCAVMINSDAAGSKLGLIGTSCEERSVAKTVTSIRQQLETEPVRDADMFGEARDVNHSKSKTGIGVLCEIIEERKSIDTLVASSEPSARTDTADSQEWPAAIQEDNRDRGIPIEPIKPRIQSRTARSSNIFGGKYLKYSKPNTSFGISCEIMEDRGTSDGIKTTVTNSEMNEWFEMETKGWVYHPALLLFDTSLRFEWNQMSVEQDHELDSESDEFLLGYDTNVTILKDKPYTLNLFALQNRSTMGSTLVEDTEMVRNQYGATLSFRNEILPGSISYTHTDSEQTGFYESTGTGDNIMVQTSHGRETWTISYSGRYNDQTQTTLDSATNVQNLDNSLRGAWDITEEGNIRLNSFLSLRVKESETFNFTTSEVDEKLTWEHAENLTSEYRANYRSTDTDGSLTTTGSIEAELTHLMYENLTTRLAGRFIMDESDDDSEETYGGLIDFNYKREIPWGEVNIDMSQDYEVTQRAGLESQIQVLEEPHRLIDGAVTFLGGEKVDKNSVRVTNAAGTIIYDENSDYTLSDVGSLVRIERTPFGPISNGSRVLVSYRYISSFGSDLTQHTQSYGIRVYLLSALSLYYDYELTTENISDGNHLDNETDEEYINAGFDFQWYWRWTDTRISFEDSTNSSGASTQRWSVEEKVSFRPRRNFLLNLKGRYAGLTFKDTDDMENTYSLGFYQGWMPYGWLKLSAEGSWEVVSSDLETSTRTEFISSLQLVYGVWIGEIRYELVEEEREVSGERRWSQLLFFEIIRERW